MSTENPLTKHTATFRKLFRSKFGMLLMDSDMCNSRKKQGCNSCSQYEQCTGYVTWWKRLLTKAEIGRAITDEDTSFNPFIDHFEDDQTPYA